MLPGVVIQLIQGGKKRFTRRVPEDRSHRLLLRQAPLHPHRPYLIKICLPCICLPEDLARFITQELRINYNPNTATGAL